MILVGSCTSSITWMLPGQHSEVRLCILVPNDCFRKYPVHTGCFQKYPIRFRGRYHTSSHVHPDTRLCDVFWRHFGCGPDKLYRLGRRKGTSWRAFQTPFKLISTHSEHCIQHFTGVSIYCIHDVRASTLLSSILPIVTTVVQNIHWDPINPHLQDVG